MRIGDLNVEEFKALVQEAIEEKLEELLGDPDLGRELRPEVKERLTRSLASIARGVRGTPSEEVAREAGLEW